ncbi:hypothetical protein MASR1M45_04800 [Candidatus Kapaibacterium sp.]
MKYMIIGCIIILSTISFANNNEFDPYFFRNNFQDDIHAGTYFYALFSIGNKFGDSSDRAFQNFDTNLYKGRKLGYVLIDLSKRYLFLRGSVINGDLCLDQNDFSRRTHFAFTFKFNDTLSLNIVGMLAKSEWFYEESDSIAFNKLLEIDKYALLPINRNMKIYYKQIIDLMKFDNSPRLKDRIESILKNYPGVAK